MAEGMTTHRINAPDAATAKLLTEAKWVPLRLEPQPVSNLALRFDYREQKLSQYDERYNHELRCWPLIQPGDTLLIAEPWGEHKFLKQPLREIDESRRCGFAVRYARDIPDKYCTRREIVEVEGPKQVKNLTADQSYRIIGESCMPRPLHAVQEFWKTLHPNGGMDDWIWLVKVK